jgi:hypothetical protein
MARIDSPPMRRAKIRCARLCSSVRNWMGLAAAGAGIGRPFGETANIAQILSVRKDLSQKVLRYVAHRPACGLVFKATFATPRLRNRPHVSAFKTACGSSTHAFA